MAKTRHQTEPSSNKSAMALMAIGGVLVGALVVWALTRTVQPASDPGAMTSVATTPVSTTAPATTTPGTTTLLPPGAISTAATATTSPLPQVKGDRSSVPRIAVEDLRAKMNRNEVTIIDVRDANSFNAKHITGSINIPFASIESMLDQIPKGKPIVTYCSCPAEESSGGAALILKEKGYSDVQALYGGLNAWSSLGYPTTP